MQRAALSRDAETPARAAAVLRRDDSSASPHGQLLALQRSVGNHALAEALRTSASPVAVARMIPPKRVRKAPNAVDQEVNWSGPTWGASDTKAGGTSVTADLGPAAGQSFNYGSGPGAKQCTDVNRLNKAGYQGRLWIKGHLLNDNLGGPGTSKNLTPMTHQANMAFKGVESAVKNALTVCYSHAAMSGKYYYGVRFSAQTVGQTWPAAALGAAKSVAQTLDAQCQYIRKPKAGGAVQVMAGTPNWTGALPLPVGNQQTNCFQ